MLYPMPSPMQYNTKTTQSESIIGRKLKADNIAQPMMTRVQLDHKYTKYVAIGAAKIAVSGDDKITDP